MRVLALCGLQIALTTGLPSSWNVQLAVALCDRRDMTERAHRPGSVATNQHVCKMSSSNTPG